MQLNPEDVTKFTLDPTQVEPTSSYEPDGYWEMLAGDVYDITKKAIKEAPSLPKKAAEAAADWYVGEYRPALKERTREVSKELGEEEPSMLSEGLASVNLLRESAASGATNVISGAASIAPDLGVLANTVISASVPRTSATYVLDSLNDLRAKGLDISDDMEDTFADALRSKDVSLLPADAPKELRVLADKVIDARNVRDMFLSAAESGAKKAKKIEDKVFEFTGAEQEGPIRDIGNVLSFISGPSGAVQIVKAGSRKQLKDATRIAAPDPTSAPNRVPVEERIVLAPDPKQQIATGEIAPKPQVPFDKDVAPKNSLIYIETDPSEMTLEGNTIREALESKNLTLGDVVSTEELGDNKFKVNVKGKVYAARGYNSLPEAVKGLDINPGDVSRLDYMTPDQFSESITKIGDKQVVQFSKGTDTTILRRTPSESPTAPDPNAAPNRLNVPSRTAPKADAKVIKELDDSFVDINTLPEDWKREFGDYAKAVAFTEGAIASPGSMDAGAVTRRGLIPIGSLLGAYAVRGSKDGFNAIYNNIFDKDGNPLPKASAVDSISAEKDLLEPYFKSLFEEDETTGAFNFRTVGQRTLSSLLKDESSGRDTKYDSKVAYAKFRMDNIDAFHMLDGINRQQAKMAGLDYGSKDIQEFSPVWAAKWMRENRQSLANLYLYGDDRGEAGAYLDEKGITQIKEGVKSFRGIYKSAVDNGANPEDVKKFQIARDAVDNYTNTHAEMGEALARANELSEEYNIPKDKWQQLFGTLYQDKDALTKLKHADTDGIANKRTLVIQQAKAIIEEVKDSNKRALVEEELTRAINAATKRSTVDFLDAQKTVDNYLTRTPWANDVNRELTALNNHILDQYVSSGLVNQSTADMWRKRHPNYLPNYKVTRVRGADYDFSDTTDIPKTLSSLSTRTISPKKNLDPIVAQALYISNAGYHIAETSVRRAILNNLMGSVSKNDFNKLFSYADKDKIQKALDDIAAGKGKKNYQVNDLLQDGVIDTSIRDVVRGTVFHVGGSTLEIPFKHNWLHDLVRDARTKEFDSEPFGKTGIIWNKLVRFKKAAITRNPAFALGIFAKELQDTFFWSQLPIHKRLEIVKAIPDLFVGKYFDKETWRLFNKTNAGIYHRNLYTSSNVDRGEAHKELAESFLADVLGNKSVGKGVWDTLRKGADAMLSATDNAPRMRYYKMLRKNGYDQASALHLAKTQGVSFTQKGLKPNGLVDNLDYVIPFQRVAFNSMDRLARRWYFENRKAATAIGVASFLDWMLEKSGVSVNEEEEGVPTYQQRKGIVFNSPIDDTFMMLQSGFVLQTEVGKQVLDYAMQTTNKYFDAGVQDWLEGMGGKQFSDRIFKNEKTAKEVTGLAAQYVWETMIPTRFDLGLADVALTWATNKTSYGTPYVSSFEEGIPASKQVREDTSRSLAALTEYLANASEGKVQISPRGAQMLGEALVPNIFELFTATLDAGLGKAGILPEFPATTPAEQVGGKYFFIPDNNGLATQRFYTMYSNLQHDVNLVEEYKTDIERRKKSGYAVDIEQESMYLNLLEKNAPQIETHAILQKYNKDIMALREQANAVIWDKDPTQVRETGDVGIEDYLTSDFGSEYKRQRLHEIKEQQAEIARQALEEVMTLPYGRDIVESNAVSFGRLLDPFINLIPVKQEKNATYDTKIDKYRLEDEDYIIEFEPLNNIQTMITNISVVDTIIETAKENGINPNNALMIAAMESKFLPDAESEYSSAKGVYQITDDTWKRLTDQRFGKAEYGITKKDDRLDPIVNIRMGILLMKEDNDKAVMNLGRELNFTEQYALHHFGYGAGMEFIRAKESAPYTSIKDVIGNKAYKANPQFKKANGTPMSVREAANMWTDRVNEVYKEVTTGDGDNE